MAVAAITALIPTLGKVLLYSLIQDKLPASGPMARGLIFGLVLLMIDDALLRTPIMMSVVGNPADVLLIQSLEGWVIPVITGLVIASIVPGSLSAKRG